MSLITPITRRSLRMTSKTALAALAIGAISAGQANAGVVQVVDTGSAHTGTTGGPNDFTFTTATVGGGGKVGLYEYSYDAGAAFDMLVVSVSREASSAAQNTSNLGANGSDAMVVTYDGVEMTLATGPTTGSSATIYYLAVSGTAGAKTIGVDFEGFQTMNGVGIGIAAIKSDDGNPIQLFDADTVGGTANGSISIDTADDSFTMFAVDTNGGNFGGSSTTNSLATAASLDVQIDKATDIGSNGFGVAYALESVGASNVNYAYLPADTSKDRGLSAANFYVVPEPGSLSLLAAGGLLMIKRRRRDTI